jgi:hypothetical protein
MSERFGQCRRCSGHVSVRVDPEHYAVHSDHLNLADCLRVLLGEVPGEQTVFYDIRDNPKLLARCKRQRFAPYRPGVLTEPSPIPLPMEQ